jgi:hypothetical protein
MTDAAATAEPRSVYRGVIHLHSAYSHDGRDSIPDLARTLSGNGFDFCILTDHFEDFDARAFDRYHAEIAAVNEDGDFVVVPAIEAEFENVHVIFVPVGSFAEIQGIVAARDLSGSEAVKLLVHPAKYDIETTITFLRDHEFDGVELWNQIADGKYSPPRDHLRALLSRIRPDLRGHFFGGDIHNCRHTVANYLTIPADGPLTTDHVIDALRRRRYVSHNRQTGLSVSAEQTAGELVAWLDAAARARSPRAALIAGIARVLKGIYHLLPRRVQKRVNSFKNSVKSRL